MKKDFVGTSDFTKEEILNIANLAILIKKNLKAGFPLNLMYHKMITMSFDKNSLLAHLPYETAASTLGGSVSHIDYDQIKNDSNIAKIMSRFSDVIIIGSKDHNIVENVANNVEVPVINGMSGYNNPTLEIGDLITILENIEDGKKLEDVKFVFVGKATEACVSLMMLITKIGAHFVQLCPKEFQLSDENKQVAEDNCKTSKGSFLVTDDLESVVGADFIYTDNANGLYMNELSDEEKIKLYPNYQVNMEMMNKAGEKCKFMYSLPIIKGEEVSDEVLSSDKSLVLLEGDNRLETARAILTTLIGKANEAQEICKRNIGE